MEIIQKRRGTGKTTELIKRLKENENLALFVHSKQEKERLIIENAVMNNKNGMFECPFRERILVIGQDKLHGTNKTAMIDNVDLVLANIVGGDISVCTASNISSFIFREKNFSGSE